MNNTKKTNNFVMSGSANFPETDEGDICGQ